MSAVSRSTARWTVEGEVWAWLGGELWAWLGGEVWAWLGGSLGEAGWSEEDGGGGGGGWEGPSSAEERSRS